MQKWKNDSSLYNCETEKNGRQVNKKLDYSTTYRKEFLDSDPIKDWPSIDRCIWLWDWAMDLIGKNLSFTDWTVLDVGTKDGQFPDFLINNSIDGLGIEYSLEYVKYAQDKGRNVIYGDACDLGFVDNLFDVVFSHHLHGLVSDYWKALQEMFRVSKKYMIALNQVPGNPKKHYSYIDSPQIFHDFIESVNCKVIYNDYLDTGQAQEWVN